MMKKSKIILPALAVILVIGLMVGPALAYFTAHSEAKGGVQVALGAKTSIDETIDGMNKIVTIKNEGPESVWVRAKAYSAYDLTYNGSNWTPKEDDEFYYYSEILNKGDSTQPLTVSITAPAAESGTSEFNVIVIYECTKVMYTDDGTVEDPDWTLAIGPTSTDSSADDSSSTEEGGEH